MRFMRIGGILFGFFLSVSTAALALEDTAVIGPEDRQSLILTVYQNDLALVDEGRVPQDEIKVRNLILPAVSPRAIPSSVRVMTTQPVASICQALSPLSLDMLLQAHVGREIGVIQSHLTTGEDTIRRARVISASNGVVLEMNGRIVAGLPGRAVFDSLPDVLKHRPALHVRLASRSAGRDSVLVQYLTDGMGWQADHIVDVTAINGAAETIRLKTRATITNGTGLAFSGANLALVAGSLNRVSSPQPVARAETMMMSAAPAMDMPVRERLGDYHVYRAAGKYALPAGEPVQVPLTAIQEFQGQRRYILSGNAQPYFSRHNRGLMATEHPMVIHTFTNTGDEPIAAGIARVYGEGAFLGEDRLQPTPSGGKVSLSIGQSFDVSANRKQTGFRVMGENSRTTESDHEIRLSNGGKHTVQVEIRENIPGDWKLLKASHDMVRDGMVAVWTLSVPANGHAALTYSVRVKR